jgi:SAM-dependent methyltransferase
MTPPPSVRRPDDLDVVRDSYDRAADSYAHMVTTSGVGDVRTQPWLKAAMDAFADGVAGRGPVLDVGCGPGQVTAYLVERGVDASGVDLSPRMVEHARRLHPHCSFAVASATELELAESSLAGVMGWWSLFNLPRDVLPQVLTSFARALMPGGQLIVATHVGSDDLVRTEAYGGVPVRWTTHRWQPEQLTALIEQAGLRLVAEVRLHPDGRQLWGPGVVVVARRDD